MRSSKEAAALQSKRAKVARQPGGRLTLDRNSCGAEQGRNDAQRVGDGLLQRKRAVGALGEREKETCREDEEHGARVGDGRNEHGGRKSIDQSRTIGQE